ncbi:hypothetical protein DSO57_1022913 [Entomophthora muscae]|uniref:Uncharacterized protein n=1 Tax=Entomophthora muscae TaxID=34485 RepID=A0ACC2SRW9_9FUNG|nr:hypothetical protein DSO57_1022913 [Entomophthora muscae]
MSMMRAMYMWLTLVFGQPDEYVGLDWGGIKYQQLSTPFLKGQSDDREYLGFKLANRMKVLVISDPSASRAAAAMNVGVGFMADTKDMPGIAHLCEHMLFSGTEKYTGADEFDNHLSLHGGVTNAETYYNSTVYHSLSSPIA